MPDDRPLKRIAFPFVGDTVGGSHVSAALLMEQLPQLGFSPVALLHHDGPLVNYLTKRNLTCQRIDLPHLTATDGGALALGRIAVMAPRLARRLRQENFDAVHANDGRMIATWLPAARLAGVVGVAHRRTRWVPSRLAYLSLHAAHRIIAISSYVQASLPATLAARAQMIANPFVEPAGNRAMARAKLGIDSGDRRPVVGFVGTLQAQKRPGIFIDAAAQLIRAGSDAQFVLIGRDGDLAAAVRRQVCDLDIVNRVTFCGFQPDAAELIAGFDMLLAPAVDEGYGRTLVEAMLAVVPVVAADSGGHREIITNGETGLLVPVDDPRALANATGRLLCAAEERHRLAANARRQMAGVMTPRAHAEAVANLYRELLALQ